MRNFVDGIVCYRNINNKKFDSFAKKNNLKIVAMRVFGGDKKIIKNNSINNLINFNLKNKNVSSIIIGINNYTQLKKIISICKKINRFIFCFFYISILDYFYFIVNTDMFF